MRFLCFDHISSAWFWVRETQSSAALSRLSGFFPCLCFSFLWGSSAPSPPCPAGLGYPWWCPWSPILPTWARPHRSSWGGLSFQFWCGFGFSTTSCVWKRVSILWSSWTRCVKSEQSSVVWFRRFDILKLFRLAAMLFPGSSSCPAFHLNAGCECATPGWSPACPVSFD